MIILYYGTFKGDVMVDIKINELLDYVNEKLKIGLSRSNRKGNESWKRFNKKKAK